ncbi:MAG: transferrin-binding protein-like solute binding protein [Paracoccus sp. (in: a-proteobacteria)]
MKRMTIFVAAGSLSLLAACGGSGGGGGSDSPANEYSEDAAHAGSVIASTASMNRTSAASMPTTGRAEYDGVVGMAFGGAPGSLANAQMLGDLDLDANFANGTITGEMDDFNTSDGQRINGELRLTNGAITGSQLSAGVSGNLTGGSTSPGAVNGSVDGEFLGNGASAVQGSGSATSTGGQLGIIFTGVKDND